MRGFFIDVFGFMNRCYYLVELFSIKRDVVFKDWDSGVVFWEVGVFFYFLWLRFFSGFFYFFKVFRGIFRLETVYFLFERNMNSDMGLMGLVVRFYFY